MRILAIDIGNLTGWAASTESGNIISGIEKLKRSRHDHPGMMLINLESFLNRIKKQLGGIDYLCYEEGGFCKGTVATQSIERKKGVLIRWCEVNEVYYQIVSVQDIKKAATGKGGGKGTDKKAIKIAAAKRFPHYNPDNDDKGDEADALFALLISCQQNGIDLP